MVRNLLVIRFGNAMFAAGWNCSYVDNVEVILVFMTVALAEAF